MHLKIFAKLKEFLALFIVKIELEVCAVENIIREISELDRIGLLSVAFRNAYADVTNSVCISGVMISQRSVEFLDKRFFFLRKRRAYGKLGEFGMKEERYS